MLLVRSTGQMSAQRCYAWLYMTLLRRQSTWAGFCWGSHHQHETGEKTKESKELSNVLKVTQPVSQAQAQAQILSVYGDEEMTVPMEIIWSNPWPHRSKHYGPRSRTELSCITINTQKFMTPFLSLKNRHLLYNQNFIISKNFLFFPNEVGTRNMRLLSIWTMIYLNWDVF